MKSNIFSQRLAKRFSKFLGLLIVPLLFASCNDFLDITPTGRVIAKTGEEYRQLLTYEYKYFPSDRAITTVRSDEMTMMPGFTSDLDYATYFDLWRWNDESPSTSTTYFGWRRYYHAIYIEITGSPPPRHSRHIYQDRVHKLSGVPCMSYHVICIVV